MVATDSRGGGRSSVHRVMTAGVAADTVAMKPPLKPAGRPGPGLLLTLGLSAVYAGIVWWCHRTGAVHAAWGALLRRWPYSERALFMVAMSAVWESVFIGTNVPLYFAYKHNWFTRYRAPGRAGKFPSQELIRDCLKHHVIDAFVVRWIILYFGYDLVVYFGMTSTVDTLPSSSVHLLGELLALILMDDTWAYWSHRALHTKWLYQRVRMHLMGTCP